MKAILEFFASNPEAVATLLVFAIGGLASIVALLYTIFATHPTIVRVLQNRSLVSIDSALSEKVQATFKGGEEVYEIKELRQIDLEILNSHPRQAVENCSITLNLRSADTTVLGVTAANSDARTPTLGGREIRTSIEKVPVKPIDPFLDSKDEVTFPAIVIQIPYLDRALQGDRVFLRITYDGPFLEPEPQGAKSISIRTYQWLQSKTWSYLVLMAITIAAVFSIKAYHSAGLPWFQRQVLSSPFF